MEQQELSFVASGNAKGYSHFERKFGSFLKKQTYSYHIIQQLHCLLFTQMSWKIMPTQRPAHKFIEALPVIAKTWKEIWYSTGGGVNKLWYIQKVEYYPAIKGNVLSSHENPLRKLTRLWVREKSRSEKVACCMISALWHYGKGKTTRNIKRLVAARRLQRREKIDKSIEHRGSLGQ